MTLGRNGELARFDADDVEEVFDETAHSSDVALNSMRLADDQLSVDLVAVAPEESGGAHGDAAEHVPQIMADQGEGVVAGHDHLVRADPLDEKVFVGPSALEGEQDGQRAAALGPFFQELPVGARPLAAHELVLLAPLLLHASPFGRAGFGLFDRLIGVRPGPPENLIGSAARIRHDGIGVFL